MRDHVQGHLLQTVLTPVGNATTTPLNQGKRNTVGKKWQAGLRYITLQYQRVISLYSNGSRCVFFWHVLPGETFHHVGNLPERPFKSTCVGYAYEYSIQYCIQRIGNTYISRMNWFSGYNTVKRHILLRAESGKRTTKMRLLRRFCPVHVEERSEEATLNSPGVDFRMIGNIAI